MPASNLNAGSHNGPSESVDAAWEEASAGWASDTQAITVLREKSFNAMRGIDMDDLGYGGITSSGVSIGPESAMRVAAVFACRRVLAEDLAKLPRLVKQTTFDVDGRQKTRIIHPIGEPRSSAERKMHSIARVVSQEPCEWLSAMQFFEWLVGTAVTQRAAYAVPTYNENGELQELLPLLPGSVSVQQLNDWTVEYHVNGYGDSWRLKPGELLQLTGPLAPDLLQGYSVSGLAAEAIGLARAIEQSQAKFHANDMRPSGILTTKSTQVKKEQREAIREAWARAYGPGGSGGIAVLDNEFEYKGLNVTGTDAQVMENRNHQVSEICRFFRVFPQLIGHSGGLQGYGSFEQAMNNHASLTLHPWVERLEQALMKALLTRDERAAGYSIQIDMDAIARGTFSDRMSAYQNASKVTHTPNELRQREGLDPIDDEAMDRVQLLSNNTGLSQGSSKPAPDNRTQKPQA